jgi:hypothetical protein
MNLFAKKVNGIKMIIIIKGATLLSIPKYPTHAVIRMNPMANCNI